MLGDWLTAIRRLRNEAAHHSMIWNRERSYAISKPCDYQVGCDLLLDRDLDTSTKKKVSQKPASYCRDPVADRPPQQPPSRRHD
jgi:hypothetical protein